MFKSMKGEMSQTFKTILKLSHNYSEEFNKPCPKCHQMTLVQPGPIDKGTGRPMVAPVCATPGCNYRVNSEAYTRRHRKEATNRARQMRYNTALGYFMQYSAQPSSQNIQRDRFNNFKTRSSIILQKNKSKAEDIADKIGDGDPIHSLFVGPTGTGKTHLAYSIVNRILQRTSYRKNILFLNMLNLSIYQKKAINDLDARKWFNSLLSEVGKADLVVIDDLGRERENRWNQTIVALIAGDRAEKPLLITSNLQDGFNRYSQQIQDRLLPSDKYMVTFDGVESYREQASNQSMANAEAQIRERRQGNPLAKNPFD